MFVVLAIIGYGVLIAGALTDGVASTVALLLLGAAVGVYVHRLRSRVRRLLAAADELRASQIERADLISDFERARRTDAVTGLGNRHQLDAALPRLVMEAGSSLSSVAVLVLDLGGLAAYRHKHGDAEADRALKALAAQWQGHMRINDVLVRVSGHEFVAVLPACSPPTAQRVAGRLVLASPSEMACSVGISSWDGSESYDELLLRANAATRGTVSIPEPVSVAD
jgi:diguanylate cyclase (GGDEF)-like protein